MLADALALYAKLGAVGAGAAIAVLLMVIAAIVHSGDGRVILGGLLLLGAALTLLGAGLVLNPSMTGLPPHVGIANGQELVIIGGLVTVAAGLATVGLWRR